MVQTKLKLLSQLKKKNEKSTNEFILEENSNSRFVYMEKLLRI